MVADNFRSWCQDLGHDVIMYHNTYSPVPKNTIYTNGWEKTDTDITFSYDDPDFKPREADLLVIYSFQQVNDFDPDNVRQRNLISGLRRFLDSSHSGGARIMLVNINHLLLKGDKKFIQAYPWIYDEIDSIITFGPSDELMKVLRKTNPVQYANNIEGKINYLFHNTTYKLSRDWSPVEGKFMNQFYWQGRTPMWKGWADWLDFKKNAAGHGIDFNLMFNGVSAAIGNVSKLCVSLKPKKFLPWLEYDPTRFRTGIEFSREIEQKTRVYAEYKHAVGIALLKKTGFSMYTTRLDRGYNFFPEYATIDALQAGTVLAMPSWYWDDDNGFLEGTPSDWGCLALPADDEDMDRFADDWHKLQDPVEYGKARSIAWDRIIEDRDDSAVISTMLGIGMGDISHYSERPYFNDHDKTGLLALLG